MLASPQTSERISVDPSLNQQTGLWDLAQRAQHSRETRDCTVLVQAWVNQICRCTGTLETNCQNNSTGRQAPPRQNHRIPVMALIIAIKQWHKLMNDISTIGSMVQAELTCELIAHVHRPVQVYVICKTFSINYLNHLINGSLLFNFSP